MRWVAWTSSATSVTSAPSIHPRCARISICIRMNFHRIVVDVFVVITCVRNSRILCDRVDTTNNNKTLCARASSIIALKLPFVIIRAFRARSRKTRSFAHARPEQLACVTTFRPTTNQKKTHTHTRSANTAYPVIVRTHTHTNMHPENMYINRKISLK